MKKVVKDLDFEKVIELRDMLFELKVEGWWLNERIVNCSKRCMSI